MEVYLLILFWILPYKMVVREKKAMLLESLDIAFS